jgi:hypothetical protein
MQQPNFDGTNGSISAANSQTFPEWSPFSFVQATVPDAAGACLTITLAATTGTATLHVYVSVNGQTAVQIPDANIYSVGSAAYGAMAVGSDQIYMVNVPPGAAYVGATAQSGAAVDVSLSTGPTLYTFPGQSAGIV